MTDSFEDILKRIFLYPPIKSSLYNNANNINVEEYASIISNFEFMLDNIKRPQDKLIFILKHLGYSAREISSLLGISKTTVTRRYNGMIKELEEL